MIQIFLTNEQASDLKEYLIRSKSYRLEEISFFEKYRDEKRVKPFRRMDQMADEIISLLQDEIEDINVF